VRKEDRVFRTLTTEEIDQHLTAISERDWASTCWTCHCVTHCAVPLCFDTVISFHSQQRNTEWTISCLTLKTSLSLYSLLHLSTWLNLQWFDYALLIAYLNVDYLVTCCIY
jgi:hypothetical protein